MRDGLTVRRFTVQDRFGTVTVRVGRPVHPLVPTLKSRSTLGPGLPGNEGVDHFLCHCLHILNGASGEITGISVEDQFKAGPVNNLRPKMLCSPVDKNGEDPDARTQEDQLTCYQTGTPDRGLNLKVWVRNQSGPGRLNVKRKRYLCVPSRIFSGRGCLARRRPGGGEGARIL